MLQYLLVCHSGSRGGFCGFTQWCHRVISSQRRKDGFQPSVDGWCWQHLLVGWCVRISRASFFFFLNLFSNASVILPVLSWDLLRNHPIFGQVREPNVSIMHKRLGYFLVAAPPVDLATSGYFGSRILQCHACVSFLDTNYSAEMCEN